MGMNREEMAAEFSQRLGEMTEVQMAYVLGLAQGLLAEQKGA